MSQGDHLFVVMDELLSHWESEEAALDAQQANISSQYQGSDYTSCIKFFGKPILPPVMTKPKRDEMRLYKHQAILAETRIRARVRQRLLARVQAVMKDIEVRKTPSLKDDWPDPGDLPPPKGFDESEEEDYSSNIPVVNLESCDMTRKGFPTDAGEGENVGGHTLDNIVSPRTVTRDSGLDGDTYISEGSVLTKEGEDEGTKTEEEQTDTMEDVTDLSTTDERQDEASVATSVERLGSTDPDSDSGERSYTDQHNTSKSYSDSQSKSYSSEERSEEEEEEGSVGYNDSDKENFENLTVLEQRTNPTRVLENEGSPQASAQPFGTRERVDHLVKQLNSVLNNDRCPPEADVIGLSMPSTSSSATTLSSEEMNQTVIAREEADCQSIGEDQEIDMTDELESGHESSEADTPPVIRQVPHHNHELVIDSQVMDGEEESSGPLRSSLLNKVEFDTPEGTSDEQENVNVAVDVAKCPPHQAAVGLTTQRGEALTLSDGVSPGPVSTPDLSTISHVSEDSRIGLCEESLINVALKLGGKVTLTKPSEKVLPASKNLSPEAAISSNTSNKTGSPHSDSKSPGVGHCVTAKSSDVSHLYTDSTELAQYMAASSDTIPSSVTTLPYTRENSGCSETNTTATPEKATPPVQKPTSGKIPASQESASSGKSESKKSHVRRSSYTLAAPSPVLLAAHAKKTYEAAQPTVTDKSKISKSQKGTPSARVHSDPKTSTTRDKMFNLTNSMEDLKLRPVHRKLDYDQQAEQQCTSQPVQKKAIHPQHVTDDSVPVPVLTSPDSDRQGKEEHLHRYLEHLSQMPAYGHVLDENQYFMSQNPHPSQDLQSAHQDVETHVSDLINIPPVVDNVLTAQHSQEMYQLQMQYFEAMKEQLIQQQQQQLAQLLAEQERQQIEMQRELMKSQQQQPGVCRNMSKPADHHYLGQNHSVILPENGDNSIDNSILYEPYDRPYSAPTPAISFALGPVNPNGHSVVGPGISPAGVYCNQSFPLMSPHTSLMETSVTRGRDDPNVSQAILYRHSTSQNDSYNSQSSNRAAANDEPPPVKTADSDHITNLPTITHQSLPPILQKRLEKLTATAKGFLTRRLMKTEKVQQLIKTIRDTAEFALHFQQETPIKKGVYSHQDRRLQERVLNQLTAAMYEIHEVFFELTTKERMAVIRQSRLLEQERMFKHQSHESNKTRRISAATMKAIERKRKAKAAEKLVLGHLRPKSCPPNTSSPKPPRSMDLRALKPIQAQLSPIKPEKETSTKAEIVIPKLVATPRKPASVAVKRIQNKPRPSSATRKTNRKPSILPATRKVFKPSTDVATKSSAPERQKIQVKTVPQKRITPDKTLPSGQAPMHSHVQTSVVNSNTKNHRSSLVPGRPSCQPSDVRKTVAQKLVRHISHSKTSPPSNSRQIIVGGNRPAS